MYVGERVAMAHIHIKPVVIVEVVIADVVKHMYAIRVVMFRVLQRIVPEAFAQDAENMMVHVAADVIVAEVVVNRIAEQHIVQSVGIRVMEIIIVVEDVVNYIVEQHTVQSVGTVVTEDVIVAEVVVNHIAEQRIVRNVDIRVTETTIVAEVVASHIAQ